MLPFFYFGLEMGLFELNHVASQLRVLHDTLIQDLADANLVK